MINIDQILESREITKVISLKDAHKSSRPRITRDKEKYEKQHERQDPGQLPLSEGNHQRGGWEDYEGPRFESRREGRKEDRQSSTEHGPC